MGTKITLKKTGSKYDADIPTNMTRPQMISFLRAAATRLEREGKWKVKR